ncbi:thiamine phosphate synthase [Marinivivus vitaminiproducens]|uniref:thiamine phosphate synthase n=1 Tax=Marinivivus vitaminiproducens TaxID=3035935 RepID=UPI0027A6F1CE|nr:thiamine phosphate synthase [Geminicoccaceae bacterium SCSIO 64248]
MTAPRTTFDLSFYPVLDLERTEGLDPVALAIAAATNGATLLQLRGKQAETRRLVELARALKAALAPFDVPLIINDRVDIALAAGAAGAHVGQDDLPAVDARALLGPDAILGLSVGTIEEAERTPSEILDYVGVGPVYATGSKADAGEPIGLEGLRDLTGRLHARESRLKVVAIGGIGIDHVPEVMATGADGVAIVSALFLAEDVGQAAAAIAHRVGTARPAMP